MGVRRADLNDRIWFGGLEFDWDVETSRWEFHVHTVTAASDHREFDDLKRLFPRTKQAPRPWFCERLSDLPGGISYCLKHHPCRKETYQSTTATLVDGRLKSFTKKYELHARELIKALKFLSRCKPEDFVISIKQR